MDHQEKQFDFVEDDAASQEEVEETVPSMDEKLRNDGLLRFKLKLGNSIECNQNPDQEIRVCKVCKKSFSSGRALGGHMRVHNQVEEDDLLEKNQNYKLKTKTHHHQKKLKNPKSTSEGYGSAIHNAAIDDSVGEGNPNKNNTTCSECGKTFPSMKSLFGHMRNHPERKWRGIRPPPSAKKSSSSTISDSIGQKVDDRIDSTTTTGRSAPDLIQSLPSWSVTARRGRKSIASLNLQDDDEDERMPEAVYDLLMLAQGESLESALSSKQRSEESEGTHKPNIEETDNCLDKCKNKRRRNKESEGGNRDFTSKKLKIDERGSLKHIKEELESSGDLDFLAGKVKAEERNGSSRFGFDQAVNMDSGWVNSDGSGKDSKQNRKDEQDYDVSGALISEMIRRKKKKKKIKLRDLERVQDMGVVDNYRHSHSQNMSLDRYKCSTCNKSFPSHQALGGHRSSHNKVKSTLQTNCMEEFALATNSLAVEQQQQFEVATTIIAQVGDSTEVVGSTHQCQICKRTFPTGQALGGHMRFHRPVEAQTSFSVVLQQEEVGQTKRPVLDFDLNEMPVMEEEEEEGLLDP